MHPLLIPDILSQIIAMLPRRDWYNVSCVSKVWDQVCSKLFDPSENDNYAIKKCAQRMNLLAIKNC